ncbi:hypothetical protein [Ruminococcus albus]|uniref:Lipoprotein n=1 Tax=Ruminococcus albus TaxID=1264 RepID=A0A1H7F6K0_RUMAL|nr:hypothetical protein [Ruminococcus albus]SEK18805.1 hypothetical protein SAMN05216469_1016 [Ruminococcus albus]
MNKRYAAVIATAIMVLGGCGKVNEPNDSEAPVKASANAQTSTDTNVTDEEETTTEQDVETTAEQDDYDFDSYYNYIIGDGAFGFDMYNNGHIRQSWDNRLAGAEYILKGMATPGMEEKALDLAVSVEQLNSLETDGFMANMKFEDTKSFRVGSEKIDGNGVTLIGYENSFIFCISYFDENDEYRETCYYEFPIDLIPDLVEAVQYADGYDVTESVDDPVVEITGGISIND